LNAEAEDHAEMLAHFLDQVQKGKVGTDKLIEKDAESFLGVALEAVKYLCCKDLFREHYSILLSRRLLQGKSVSDDLEKLAIELLKQMLGPQYTKKMEDMILDFATSSELAKEGGVSTSRTGLPDVSVGVLKTSLWPAMVMFPKTTLPRSMAQAKKMFEDWFRAKNSTRLVW
jgi:hypothetical protein